VRHDSNTRGIHVDQNMVECRQLPQKQLFERTDILRTVVFLQVDLLDLPPGKWQGRKGRDGARQNAEIDVGSFRFNEVPDSIDPTPKLT